MKLLNKTLRSYFLYSFTILLVTIPLFYFVVRSVLLHAVDRSLKNQLAEIRSNLYTIRSQNELEAWSKLDKDILLSPAERNFSDSIYTIYREGKRHHHKDMDPFREIAGIIEVGGNKYRIAINISLVENEDLLGSILMIQTTLLILLMAGMIWINQRISKKIWQPFYTALDSMRQYELTKNTKPSFTGTDIVEFKELNSAIKNLLDRTYEVYIEQKEFTENASHEMQTPLAIFQSKLELLMQTNPLTEEQAGLIDDLENTNHRLARLNKSLLLLAKIENNQYPVIEEINVTSMIESMVRQLRDRPDTEKISNIKENYVGKLMVKADGSLIEILLSNLISNGLKHNIRNGSLGIETDTRSLTIKNTGPTTALDSKKIFERFHKGTVAANNTNSTGIGLAIVRKICDLYGYRITYSFQENLHQFTVSFQ